MPPDVEVFAAGGIVVDSTGCVLVVHRPRYNDWSFPKGKLDPGETLAECAVREVREETGYECVLGTVVATIHYTDHRGRFKEVRYWQMSPVSDTEGRVVDDPAVVNRDVGSPTKDRDFVGSDYNFVPNEEVDQIRWVDPGSAAELLSYPRDRDVLKAFLGKF